MENKRETEKTKIFFISDLHFDHPDRIKKGYPMERQIDHFIFEYKIWHKNEPNNFLIIIGDSFSNFMNTMLFIKQLEQEKIKGFYVLGNHDYWNDGKLSVKEIENLFISTFKKNKYFKLLYSGVTYQIGNLTIIGDCGWTSFQRTNDVTVLDYLSRYRLPELKHTKNFSVELVKSMHNDWIRFANGVIQRNKKVLVVTHFPMFDNTESERDLWWSSWCKIKNNNFFCLYGHNHKNTIFKKYNWSNQRGYRVDAKMDLLYLSKINYDEKKIILPYQNLMKSVSIPKKITPKIFIDYKNGYKRVAQNRKNFNALIEDKDAYTKKIDDILENYRLNQIGGWVIGSAYSINRRDSIKRVQDANDYLKKHDINDNIILYMTAAVVTGYAWNNMIGWVSGMRPVNPSDVYRWYLYYINIKINKINLKEVSQVKSTMVKLPGTTIALPRVNGKEIPVKYRLGLQKQFELTFNKAIKNSRFLLEKKTRN